MSIKKYGTPDKSKIIIETKEACDIVAEILNYGISQNQIVYIINDLALNLENPDHMRRIVNAVKAVKDDSIVITNKSPLEV